MKKNKTCTYAQYEELKNLFSGKRPSGKLFNKLLQPLPAERREAYYTHAFFLFLNAYYQVPVHYQQFLKNFVHQQPDHYLAYLFTTSGMGELRCTINAKEWLIPIAHLLASDKEKLDASLPHLAFCLLLSFNPLPTTDSKERLLLTTTLASYIRRCQFTPEMFFELAEKTKIIDD